MNCDEKLVVLVFVFVGGSRWWVAGDRRECRDSLATRLSKRVYLSCDQKVDVVRVLWKRCKGSGSGSGERHHYLQVDKSGSGWYSDGRTGFKIANGQCWATLVVQSIKRSWLITECGQSGPA